MQKLGNHQPISGQGNGQVQEKEHGDLLVFRVYIPDAGMFIPHSAFSKGGAHRQNIQRNNSAVLKRMESLHTSFLYCRLFLLCFMFHHRNNKAQMNHC